MNAKEVVQSKEFRATFPDWDRLRYEALMLWRVSESKESEVSVALRNAARAMHAAWELLYHLPIDEKLYWSERFPDEEPGHEMYNDATAKETHAELERRKLTGEHKK